MSLSSHRGPDASKAIIINKSTAISHNRLSIIDPTPIADQPIVIDDRYYLSFNGEIYNYKSLRDTLKNNGVEFKTNSDSEVLMQLIIAEGKDAIHKLEGIYAFVFHDSGSNYTLASRDRSGIKPLFYIDRDQSILISSECNPLKEPFEDIRIDPLKLAHTLQYKYPDQGCIYNGINSLSPEYLLEIQNGKLSLSTKKTTSRSLSTFKRLFTEAVSLNMTSDVPVGISLSGGVDSRSILLEAHNLGYKNLTCFYVNCDEDINERDELVQLTNRLGYHLIEVDYQTNFNTEFKNYIHALDQPIGDIAGFLTYLITKKANEHGIKTLLSGIGADELFAGYNRHRAIKNHTLLSLVPWFLFEKSNRLFDKLSKSIRFSKTESWNNFISLSLPFLSKRSLSSSISNLKDALSHDQNNYLRFQILPLADLAGMANSVEIRVPFLYSGLIHYSNSQPSSYYFKKSVKWELKERFNFKKRTKKGFGIPITKTPYITQALKELSDKKHVFYTFISYDETQQLISNPFQKSFPYTLEVWNLIILSTWLKNNWFR